MSAINRSNHANDHNTNDHNAKDLDQEKRATSRGYDGGFSRGRDGSTVNRDKSDHSVGSRSNSLMGGSDAFGGYDDYDRGTFSNENAQGERSADRDMSGGSTQKSGDKGSNG